MPGLLPHSAFGIPRLVCTQRAYFYKSLKLGIISHVWVAKKKRSPLDTEALLPGGLLIHCSCKLSEQCSQGDKTNRKDSRKLITS